jgi:PAN domain-containing protein
MALAWDLRSMQSSVGFGGADRVMIGFLFLIFKAALFVLSSGVVFSEWGKKSKSLFALACAVAVLSGFFLTLDVYGRIVGSSFQPTDRQLPTAPPVGERTRGLSEDQTAVLQREKEDAARRAREATAQRERNEGARREREAAAQREREETAAREREAAAQREREEAARREQEAAAQREREEAARREREATAQREREETARREREATAQREREQSRRRLAAVISGYGFQLRENTNMQGTGLGSISPYRLVRDLSECAETCQGIARCAAFSFHKVRQSDSRHYCYLYGPPVRSLDNGSWTSGVR